MWEEYLVNFFLSGVEKLLARLGTEPTTLDISSLSSANDHSAMVTFPIAKNNSAKGSLSKLHCLFVDFHTIGVELGPKGWVYLLCAGEFKEAWRQTSRTY